METKICSKCHKRKNIQEFYKNKAYKGGFCHWCRKCKYEYKKKWRKENAWFIHYTDAKQRCNNPKSAGFKNYGGKGIKFLMTSQQVKYLWFRDKAYLMKQASIDRINSNKNYNLENCRFIEMIENAKNTMFKKGHKINQGKSNRRN